jgi:hypothetical protein
VILKPMTVGQHTLYLHGEYPEYGYFADRKIQVTVTS